MNSLVSHRCSLSQDSLFSTMKISVSPKTLDYKHARSFISRNSAHQLKEKSKRKKYKQQRTKQKKKIVEKIVSSRISLHTQLKTHQSDKSSSE